MPVLSHFKWPIKGKAWWKPMLSSPFVLRHSVAVREKTASRSTSAASMCGHTLLLIMLTSYSLLSPSLLPRKRRHACLLFSLVLFLSCDFSSNKTWTPTIVAFSTHVVLSNAKVFIHSAFNTTPEKKRYTVCKNAESIGVAICCFNSMCMLILWWYPEKNGVVPDSDRRRGGLWCWVPLRSEFPCDAMKVDEWLWYGLIWSGADGVGVVGWRERERVPAGRQQAG